MGAPQAKKIKENLPANIALNAVPLQSDKIYILINFQAGDDNRSGLSSLLLF